MFGAGIALAAIMFTIASDDRLPVLVRAFVAVLGALSLAFALSRGRVPQ